MATDITILTATAATATQTSITFKIPRRFDHYLLYIDVTAGSTLLLDMTIEVYLPGPDSWETLDTDIPSAAGITGTGLTIRVIHQSTGLSESDITQLRMAMGGDLRVVVTHGNANAATYKVYIQPL